MKVKKHYPRSYWTKERVKNGLRRFVRDYFEGDEENLPPRAHNYRFAVPREDQRMAKRLRLYPPFEVVLRFYPSLVAAWADIGYEVEETSLEYWTRKEVLRGLKRFYADFGECPTYHGYLEKSQFSPRHNKQGSPDPNGAYGKYPSFLVIRKYFQTMREAWTAAGFDMDRHWEAWSPDEDWFILESVGVLPRTEVSEYIKRTVPAIKRRLYDLGRTNSKNRWGMSVNRAAQLLGVIGGHVISKYFDYGIIPYFRGNKQIYINPADLILVREIDWSKPVNPELEDLMRRAFVQRILKIIRFGAGWRSKEIYTFQKKKDYLAKRIKSPRESAFAKDLPAPPNDLETGDWVTLKIRIRQVAEGRRGVIKGIYYSPQKQPRTDGTRRTCWIASVEFPKIKRFTKEGENRIRYNLPLDALEKTGKPDVEPKPLSMHPDAVRSRQRFKKHLARAGKRFDEIRGELT